MNARRIRTKLALGAVLGLAVAGTALAATGTEPSTTTDPYVEPVADGVDLTSLLTVETGSDGGAATDGYQMVGIPDGRTGRSTRTRSRSSTERTSPTPAPVRALLLGIALAPRQLYNGETDNGYDGQIYFANEESGDGGATSGSRRPAGRSSSRGSVCSPGAGASSGSARP
jgi:hypothetical protein